MANGMPFDNYKVQCAKWKFTGVGVVYQYHLQMEITCRSGSWILAEIYGFFSVANLRKTSDNVLLGARVWFYEYDVDRMFIACGKFCDVFVHK